MYFIGCCFLIIFQLYFTVETACMFVKVLKQSVYFSLLESTRERISDENETSQDAGNEKDGKDVSLCTYPPPPCTAMAC